MTGQPIETDRDRKQITRAEFLRIVDEASHGCAMSTREKLRAVALRTDAVAIGWFHCDGVDCPARQAGRHNQRFQESFDRAMAKRFGREVTDVDAQPFRPFVVEIVG